MKNETEYSGSILSFFRKTAALNVAGLEYEKECFELVGEVISLSENTYAKTHVSGGGSISGQHGGSVSVSSSTTTHNKMIFWLKTEDGREERIEFTDNTIELRESHIIKVVYSKNSRKMLRLKNLTTGNYWRFAPNIQKRTLKNNFSDMALTILFSLPGINLFLAFYFISGKGNKEANFTDESLVYKPNIIFFFLTVCLGLIASLYSLDAIVFTISLIPILVASYLFNRKGTNYSIIRSNQLDEIMAKG